MLQYLERFLQISPWLFSTGIDLAQQAQKLWATFQKGSPSQEDWDWLHTMEKQQEAAIQAPIPEDEL